MKVKSLAMVAGVGCSLLMAATSQAALLGIVTEKDPFALNKKDLLADLPGYNGESVWNIYAQFSDPTDQGVGVVGTPTNPFSVFTQNGAGFVNDDEFGDDTAPTQAFADLVPALNWDSFYTIGLKTTNPDDELVVAPGTPGPNTDKWPADPAESINMAWTVPPTIQGVPVPQSVAGNDQGGYNRVLLMRLAVPDQDTHIEGSFGLLWFDGQTGESFETGVMFKTLPAPGALALLGLAGLAGVSRRRRA